MDAGDKQRGDDPAAENVAVPDQDRVADEERGQHRGQEVPRTRPEAGTGYARVFGPRGSEVPSSPAGEPPQRPPPDAGYAFGSDMPIGIGEDSPMNEGSEDIAVPPVDPAEHRPRD